MSSISDNPRVYNGAYGLCRNPSGQLLLVRLASGLDKGLWTLPGGGVEWGEHPDDTVLRELEEESGITDVRNIRVHAIYSHKYMRSEDHPYDSVHYIGIIYELTLGRFDLRFEQGGSTDRCEWFTESQVQQLPLTPIAQFAFVPATAVLPDHAACVQVKRSQ